MKKLLAILLTILVLFSSLITATAQPKDFLLGDVDLNGDVSIIDATLIQLFLAEKTALNSDQQKGADTDSNGEVNILDATLIQKLLADIITEFPQRPDETVPEQDEQLLALAENINLAQSENSLTISLVSDIHYDQKIESEKQKLENIEKIGELQQLTNVDYVANLGDVVAGWYDKQSTIDALNTIFSKTQAESGAPVLNVRGNHDDNGWYSYGNFGGSYKSDEIINDVEWHNIALLNMPQNFVFDENKPYGGYGYIDHEDSKIRIFVLNTSDIPYIVEDDGTYRYNSYQCNGFSDEQLNFVADALKFEDKEAPNDWAAMFLMHTPLDTTNDNGYRFGVLDALLRGYTQMLGIISAYRKGVAYSFSGSVYNRDFVTDVPEDFNVDIDVDYSNKGAGDVICFVNGHSHTDNCSQEVGKEGSLSRGYTYLGVIGSTGFSTMVVDREKSTVSVFKYGKVKTQKESTHNIGAIDGEAEYGIDMSGGQWVIPFEQFRPTGENLYNGMSELWSGSYSVDTTATLDQETLELSTAKTSKSYKLTKAIKVKSATQYCIPTDFVGSICCFNATNNKFNGYLKPVDGIFTSKDSGGYVVFTFHSTYKDYENFFIKERCNNLSN